MVSLRLVAIIWTDTRENVHDVEKELLIIDIASWITLHPRLRLDN